MLSIAKPRLRRCYHLAFKEFFDSYCWGEKRHEHLVVTYGYFLRPKVKAEMAKLSSCERVDIATLVREFEAYSSGGKVELFLDNLAHFYRRYLLTLGKAGAGIALARMLELIEIVEYRVRHLERR
ncbi:hypothetical protein [Candidatus Pyrohabitans sp.]